MKPEKVIEMAKLHPNAQEPDAFLHDDGYWTAAKTDAGRTLSNRLHFAGSPKVGVFTSQQPAPVREAAPLLTPSEIAAEASRHWTDDGVDPIEFARTIEALVRQKAGL